MKYRRLGRTGLYVSEMCLGTMTFGGEGFWKAVGELDQEAATGLVRAALEHGVNFVDTADVYSEGKSEEITGQAIRDLGIKRSDVVAARFQLAQHASQEMRVAVVPAAAQGMREVDDPHAAAFSRSPIRLA